MTAWLGAMALLIKREYFKTTTELRAEAATRVGPGASYYTLSMGGQPVGYSSSTIDTTPTAVVIQTNMVLDIEALGSVQRVGAVMQVEMSRDLRLRTFDMQLTSQSTRYRAQGRVDGDSILEVTIIAGSTSHQRIPLEEPLTLSELVNLQLAIGGQLEVGREYTVRTIDPLSMQPSHATMRVLAESTFVFPDSAVFDSTADRWVPASYDTVRAFRVSQRSTGTTSESWIDGQGQLVRGMMQSLTTERTAFEIAVQNYRRDRDRGRTVAAGAGSDLINNTAIAANAELTPENLERLRVRLRQVDLAGFDLTGGRQQLSGDTLTVTRESAVGSRQPEQMLPIASAGDTAVANALQPEPLVQSTDPRIMAQMRLIVGRERRAARVAELINTWVHDNLEKAITISVPSASQVLETRSGDCNEHTVLYVALARAAGLPARTAAGVVYLRGRFFYHAWPEVWLGDQWVAVDPTFGQFPADAAHLRFVIGGLARQVELIRLIGRLELDVVP